MLKIELLINTLLFNSTLLDEISDQGISVKVLSVV
jgi:hypothetical protein